MPVTRRFALLVAALAAPAAGCFHFADDDRPSFEITRFETDESSDDLSGHLSWSISDPEGVVERCELFPGDGSPVQEVDCDAGSATHFYPSPGNYTASLYVWSADTSVTASTVVLAEQLPGPGATP